MNSVFFPKPVGTARNTNTRVGMPRTVLFCFIQMRKIREKKCFKINAGIW